MSTRLRSFPPISSPGARVLILGSMPGAESLRQQRYYAHPRNAFWPIMLTLLRIPEQESISMPYKDRIRLLQDGGIALWDVLQTCEREGSLDSAIDRNSEIPNDFSSFIRQHQQLNAICFNGAKSEQVFRRSVLPGLDEPAISLTFHRLPSSSPAHASMSLKEKLAAWDQVIRPYLQPG